MSETIIFSFNAVAPMLLLILLGYFLQRGRRRNESFFSDLNQLVFSVFLPLMIFNGIYNIETFEDVNWGAVLYCVLMIFLLFFLGWAAQRFFVKERSQKGVIWQSIFRSNFALMGLALAQLIGGDSALAFASVISAAVMPAFNILAVICFAATSEEGTGDHLKNTLTKIVKNPLIHGAVFGILALAIRALLPVKADGTPVFSIRFNLPFVYTALGNISKVASPLSLIVLGAQFRLPRGAGEYKLLSMGVIGKIVIAPCLGIGIAILLNSLSICRFGVSEYPALIGLFATPTGVSSAVVAQSMGGDSALANRIVVFTSLFSILSIVVIIGLMRGLGFM